jgi:hypothetical protein
MSRNFQVVSIWSAANGDFGRMKGFSAQMQQDARILADRIHQHRPIEGHSRFPQDDDGFCLQIGQMAG